MRAVTRDAAYFALPVMLQTLIFIAVPD